MDTAFTNTINENEKSNNSQVQTEFDRWIRKDVTKIVSKHLKASDFNEEKLAIQFKVKGFNKGTFYLIVDKNRSEKKEQIQVQPYDYKDYDINIEGDSSLILKLLKKQLVLNEEIYNKNLSVSVNEKFNNSKNDLIDRISYSLKPTELYSLLKANLYTNTNFILFVFSISCFLCGILSSIIANSINELYPAYTLGIFFAVGLVTFPLMNRSTLDKITYILINIALLLAAILIFYNIFYYCYLKDFSTVAHPLPIFIVMTISLLIVCLIACYIIFAAIYKFWIFFSNIINKIISFDKTEDSENYKIQIKNEFILKFIAIITTAFTIIATVTPVVAAIIEMIKK